MLDCCVDLIDLEMDSLNVCRVHYLMQSIKPHFVEKTGREMDFNAIIRPAHFYLWMAYERHLKAPPFRLLRHPFVVVRRNGLPRAEPAQNDPRLHTSQAKAGNDGVKLRCELRPDNNIALVFCHIALIGGEERQPVQNGKDRRDIDEFDATEAFRDTKTCHGLEVHVDCRDDEARQRVSRDREVVEHAAAAYNTQRHLAGDIGMAYIVVRNDAGIVRARRIV